jgi:ketosteroid isomerase-like protein
MSRAQGIISLFLRVLLLCGAIAPVTGLSSPALAQSPRESAAVAAVVERYHGALKTGDSAAALAQLAEDAVILESGGMESRQEYRSHHLPADIAFARSVKGARSPLRVTVRGDVAWTTSTSTARGEYRGKPVSSSGAELIVLTRSGGGWKISAIHWSSRND